MVNIFLGKTDSELRYISLTIEGKIMNIEDGPLFSKRTMLEFAKDRMVLEALSSYKSTLTLNRRY